MSYEQWFPFIRFPIPIAQFHQLPTNPTYKYEYIDGEAWLTARPKGYHALLTLEPCSVAETVRGFHGETITIRRLRDDDWDRLPSVFAGAFHRVPPFGLIDRTERPIAAAECLARTREGQDGLLIERACFVARSEPDDVGEERLTGAALITLNAEHDLESFDGASHDVDVPEDAIEQAWGRPHLTWIFVSGWSARFGIGTALLARVVNELIALGYNELASPFLLGNESSTLWHWRNGFRLLSWPGSQRAMEQADGWPVIRVPGIFGRRPPGDSRTDG